MTMSGPSTISQPGTYEWLAHDVTGSEDPQYRTYKWYKDGAVVSTADSWAATFDRDDNGTFSLSVVLSDAVGESDTDSRNISVAIESVCIPGDPCAIGNE